MPSIAPGNRLGSSLSPYLLQHKDNPVHWQPWDDAALALARERDVPILLSIGYASCHWCHVMERESFADAETARLMNENFVCVKVDREERPDLDKTYQMAYFLLSRQAGGWPLTVFLAPGDLVPFHAGTYYPPQPRGSMPSLGDILRRVMVVWEKGREQIEEQNGHVGARIAQLDEAPAQMEFDPEEAGELCRRQLRQRFDADNGGLDRAPKFPQLPSLLYALVHAAQGDAQLRAHLGLTLDVIAQRGLRDHVGGGFFRYCVDPLWDIPHFEKMLTDNAMLAELYARAGAAYGNDRYLEVAADVCAWLRTEMELEPGGYASALDADSEGEEGRFYVWERAELEGGLDAAGLAALDEHANAAEPANFAGGVLHLRMKHAPSYEGRPPALAAALARLRALRADRPAPAVDGKMLAGNCALVAQALAVAGRIMDDDGLRAAARQADAFIATRLRTGKRLMLYRTTAGLASQAAFLDDWAYWLQARVTMLQEDPSVARVKEVEEMIDAIGELFDDGGGGLLFAPRDASAALRRTRSCDDGSQPSGNGVVAQALVNFAHLSAQPQHLDRAEGIVKAFSAYLREGPGHCPTLLRAAELLHEPPPMAIFPAGADAASWIKSLLPAYARGALLVVAGEDAAPAVAKPAKPDGGCWAYPCDGMKCGEPISDLEELKRHLGVSG